VHKLSGLLKKEGPMNDVLFYFIKLSEIRQVFSFLDAIRSVRYVIIPLGSKRNDLTKM